MYICLVMSKTVAIVVAGGVGSRMGLDLPKQFVEVEGKPVLFYTLEGFQNHPMVDEIVLVCIDGWQDDVRAWAAQYGISKLTQIVSGGASVQESIRNGVFSLEGHCDSDDIVIVHDGIRPLVDASVLTDVVEKSKVFGNAVTSLPYNEQIFLVDDKDPSTTVRYIPRETLRRVSTPQAYRFDLIDPAYHEAFEKGIGKAGSWFSGRKDELVQIRSLLQENAALKEEVARLTEENTLLQQDKYELNKLRQLFELDEQYEEYHKVGARIMSLQDPTRKMSKSDPEDTYIAILDKPDVIRKKVRRAKTDSESSVVYDPENKPGVSNLLSIMSALGAGEIDALCDEIPLLRKYRCDADLTVDRQGRGDYMSLEQAVAAAQAQSKQTTTIQILGGEWQKPQLPKKSRIEFVLREGATWK